MQPEQTQEFRLNVSNKARISDIYGPFPPVDVAYSCAHTRQVV